MKFVSLVNLYSLESNYSQIFKEPTCSQLWDRPEFHESLCKEAPPHQCSPAKNPNSIKKRVRKDNSSLTKKTCHIIYLSLWAETNDMLTPFQHHLHHCEQSEGVCCKIGMASMSEINVRYEVISDMNLSQIWISYLLEDWHEIYVWLRQKVYPWWARTSRLLTSSVEPLLLQYQSLRVWVGGTEAALSWDAQVEGARS